MKKLNQVKIFFYIAKLSLFIPALYLYDIVIRKMDKIYENRF